MWIARSGKNDFTRKNPLFESLIGKLKNNAELHAILENLLFSGKTVAYNTDNEIIDSAAMFGFIKNQKGMVVIANRLFETRLYNYYLSEEKMRNKRNEAHGCDC